MSAKITNNPEVFIAGLKEQFHEPPKIADSTVVFLYSEIHSLMMFVASTFLVKNNSTGNLFFYCREWINQAECYNTGIFFPENIKFKETEVVLSESQLTEIQSLLKPTFVPPKDLELLLLDGSYFTLKFYGELQTEFKWRHSSQLESGLNTLTKFIKEATKLDFG